RWEVCAYPSTTPCGWVAGSRRSSGAGCAAGIVDTVKQVVDSVNDGRGDALRVLRARWPAARGRVRADGGEARAGRALRAPGLPAGRGDLVFQPEGGAAIRRC